MRTAVIVTAARLTRNLAPAAGGLGLAQAVTYAKAAGSVRHSEQTGPPGRCRAWRP